MKILLIANSWILMAPAFAMGSPPETLGFSLIGESSTRSTPIEAEVDAFDEYSGESLADAKITHERMNGSLQVIHVSRPGFNSVSLIGVTSPRVHVYLKPLAALQTAAIARGRLSGYSPFISGSVEGGLVFALSVLDLEGDLQTLIPADVKAAKAGSYETQSAPSIGLSTVSALPAGALQKTIVAAVSSGDGRVSASVIPVHESW